MVSPRARVIIDNDFSGDPDDLFQLVHHMLSPSVDVRCAIGSHLSVDDPFDGSAVQAENAVRIARETLDLLGPAYDVPVMLGSNIGLSDPGQPIPSEASEAIVAEAMREDTDLPLFVVLGAGLTELASAHLQEPRIAERLTAVWIGGSEHPGLADPPPGPPEVEYNLNIDIAAAQTVFNESSIPIWQIPRDVYRQCIVSMAELEVKVRPRGELGEYLVSSLERIIVRANERGHSMGETYVLGDSPLVLVTALGTAFRPDSASSFHVTIPTPFITASGTYESNPFGRPMRVYTRIDNRQMFDDFYAKLELFDRPRSVSDTHS